jgi:hypothetical protein
MEEKIKYKQWDDEEKKYYLREETEEEIRNFLIGTLETYLDVCKDEIGDPDIIERWSCKVHDNEDYIKASISNRGAYLNIEVSLFEKMSVTLTAHRDGLDVYNLLEIGMIYLHPNYLPYSYQLIRVIDHVAWVLGCEKAQYRIMSPKSFEMGFLYENGYSLNIVDMDGFIYLEKHYREEYGYIIRNEGQESDAPAEG